MKKIEIKTHDLYLEYMVDAMVAHLKENGYPFYDAQPVKFVKDGCNAFWDNWYVSATIDNLFTKPFDAAIAHKSCRVQRSRGGVDYFSLSTRDAMFKIDGNYYYMSV